MILDFYFKLLNHFDQYKLLGVIRIKRFIRKSTEVIFKPQDSFSYVAIGMAVLLLITKLSGLLKLQILAGIYGISSELDLFTAANRIPEFIYTVVAIGGINAALIPVLQQASLKEDQEKIKVVFSSIVNTFFIILLVISALVFIFAPQVVNFSLSLNPHESPTRSLSAEQVDIFVKMLRILIFSPIILCLSSIFSSILQVRKRFLITQLAPLFYNFGLIFVAIAVIPFFNNSILVLSTGVILGSLLHFLIQVPSIMSAKVEYSIKSFNFKDKYVIQALKQAAPRTIGLTSDYIGNIFQTIIAIGLPAGSLAAFAFATSIRDIPISMFGISTSQALFPTMSELAEKKDMEGLQKIFSKGVRAILFWTLPASVLLIVLRTPYVRILFSLFTDAVTFAGIRILSFALLFLCFGIVFYSLLNLVNRAFYSLNDSKTPTYVSMFVIGIEIVLTYLFVNLLSHFNSLSVNPFQIVQNFENYFTNGGSVAAVGGLGLASSTAIFINLAILIYFLKKKGVNFFYESEYILSKVASALTMFVIGISSFKLMDIFFDLERTGGLLIFTANVTILMLLAYYYCEKFLNDDDVKMLDHPIQKIKISFSKIGKLIKSKRLTGVTPS